MNTRFEQTRLLIADYILNAISWNDTCISLPPPNVVFYLCSFREMIHVYHCLHRTLCFKFAHFVKWYMYIIASTERCVLNLLILWNDTCISLPPPNVVFYLCSFREMMHVYHCLHRTLCFIFAHFVKWYMYIIASTERCVLPLLIMSVCPFLCNMTENRMNRFSCNLQARSLCPH